MKRDIEQELKSQPEIINNDFMIQNIEKGFQRLKRFYQQNNNIEEEYFDDIEKEIKEDWKNQIVENRCYKAQGKYCVDFLVSL